MGKTERQQQKGDWACREQRWTESKESTEGRDTRKDLPTVRFVTSHKQVPCQWLPEGGSQSQGIHVTAKGKKLSAKLFPYCDKRCSSSSSITLLVWEYSAGIITSEKVGWGTWLCVPAGVSNQSPFAPWQRNGATVAPPGNATKLYHLIRWLRGFLEKSTLF